MQAKASKKKTPAKSARKRPAAASKKAAKTGSKTAAPARKKTAATRPATKGSAPHPPAAPGPAVEKVPAKPPKPPRKAGGAGSITARRKRHREHRERLLRKQSDLMQAYSISKGDSQSHLDNGTEDYIDYAVNSYAREFLLSLTEMDRKQLLLVEEALRRIDRGEYGNCQQCGEEIAPKRLEVVPWVRHCVRCQELEEKGLLPQSALSLAEGEEGAEDEEGAEEDIRDEGVPGESDEDEEEGSDADDLPEVAGEIDGADDAVADDEEETEA